MSTAEAAGEPALLSEFGVTEDGFRRPGIDVIWDAAVREFEQRIGRELTSPTEGELQYIEAVVLWTDQWYKTAEANYYAGYFDTASGEQLDHLLSIMGFQRLPRRDATGEVTFFAPDGGNPGDVSIPAGTRVVAPGDETTPRIIFQTTEPATLPAGQARVERVPIKALDPIRSNLDLAPDQVGAETNVPPLSISEILDSKGGLARVENPLPTGASGVRDDTGETYSFVSGRDRELDSEFRRRYLNSLALGGQATKDAVEAAIRNAGDGSLVSAVRVDETLEITQNEDGSYSGRQIEPTLVLSENTQVTRNQVAQAIYDKRAAGIESVGETGGTAEQLDGQTYDAGLGFTLADKVSLYVDAEVVVDETFPGDGEAQLAANVLETIGGTDVDGTYIEGSAIGEDIYYSEILGDLMGADVSGIFDYNHIRVGRQESPTGTSNISISPSEVARTDPTSISVRAVPGDRA